MTHPLDPHHSVGHIRRRLFLLLTQAFGTVVAFTAGLLVSLIALFAYGMARDDPPFSPPIVSSLETFYRVRGSWDGVDALSVRLPASSPRENLEKWILLDPNGRVVLNRGGEESAAGVGGIYEVRRQDWRFPLRVDGQRVGTLVYPARSLLELLPLLLNLIPPVGVISFFTGLVTLLIGVLLMRRVVSPLADVIAAAQSVADGDLTARVQVRGPSDLRSLNDSFNRMAGALERSDRERKDLLADIAHELRTPLTILRGRLEGIVDGIYPADDAHIAPVLEETYVLERLVEDLRLLTLAESRQLHFDRSPTGLAELAERAVGLFEAEAAEKRIALDFEAEPRLPPVEADPQRVEQVVGNLVSNALQYTPPDGRVTISVRRAAGGVELAVSDNGPGVPEADLPRLFDRFWRGEKSRSRSAGGAGLGLAIARQLVEAQGGTIGASNLPGGGLRVAFVMRPHHAPPLA